MDSPKPSNPSSSSQSPSLDSLRTVEFRQTLRGYHIDDVDEYLERVAVEAEALQEQFRQGNERLKQAADRIAQLEQMVQQAQRDQPASAAAPAAATDDSLQRTLLLAQKFVDQTQAEAEAEARAKVAEAEGHARNLLREAEEKARSLTEDTERRLREEIARLESIRTQLAGDVETIARHMENERNRLRGALGEMLAWVDEHVQPAATLLAQPAPTAPATDAPALPDDGDGAGAPAAAAAAPAARPEPSPMSPPGGAPPAPTPPAGSMPAGVPPTDAPAAGERRVPASEVPLERPVTTGPGAAPGLERVTDTTNGRAGVPH
jgi:DivIVA domain-containing protein